jgi:ATP-dependent helicase HrpB
MDDTDLPVQAFLPEIGRLLCKKGILVLSAESGAGKTTLVPPGLLQSGALGDGRLIMLEPRRAAAAQAALRIAENLGEAIGARVGYRVRGESRESGACRILVLTEALLTRLIQDDPGLSGTSVLIFDEYHERSIHADLALALALEARLLRPELKILVMSATLEAEKTAAFIEASQGSSPAVLSVPGRAFPIQTVYRPLPRRGRFEPEFAASLRGIFSETEGDLLAFLPGRGEIERCQRELADLSRDADIVQLHGSLPLEEQRRVISGHSDRRRRVILSTNIAQTSLTVPGVRAVVDSGLTRLTRFHVQSGMDRLATESESEMDAVQRAGRAGRLGPGQAFKLWPEAEVLPARSDPEILRADLSALVLEAAIWGARGPDALPFPDAPPKAAWSRATALLSELGLLDADGAPTRLGRDCARIGLNPRLAAMVLREKRPIAAACAALLEERDQSGYRGEADFRLRLEILRKGGRDAPEAASRSWIERVKQEAARIRSLAGIQGASWSAAEELEAGDFLLWAFPDRICRLEKGLYRLITGRSARLSSPGGGALAGSLEGREWLLALEADSGESLGLIHLAAPLSEAAVRERILPRGKPGFRLEWKGLRPGPRSEISIGRIVLPPGSAKAAGAPGGASLEDVVKAGFLERLSDEGLAVLPWSEASLDLRRRASFFAAAIAPTGFPGLSDAELASSASRWLLPFLDMSGARAADIAPQAFLPPLLEADGLLDALRELLRPWRSDIERECPESVELPTGGRRSLDYGEGSQATLEARIQEVFGMTVHPKAGGKPVLMRLLSPANRPMQSTSDIGGFWKNSYPELRKELRGRYPRHFWPEDGASAQATSRAKPRGS